MPDTIVLASGNPGKVREISQMLKGIALAIKPQSEFSVAEVPETGLSFVENALIKARHAARHAGLAAIADDSGIAVDALQGAPGIYSARYAGEGASDQQNLDKLINAISDIPELNRTAAFVCVMVYVRHAEDPLPIIAQGVWPGRLLTEARGENGFGYDPIFYLDDHQCTSAELSPDKKNAISHRGMALQKLVAQLTRLKQ